MACISIMIFACSFINEDREANETDSERIIGYWRSFEQENGDSVYYVTHTGFLEYEIDSAFELNSIVKKENEGLMYKFYSDSSITASNDKIRKYALQNDTITFFLSDTFNSGDGAIVPINWTAKKV